MVLAWRLLGVKLVFDKGRVGSTAVRIGAQSAIAGAATGAAQLTCSEGEEPCGGARACRMGSTVFFFLGARMG